MVEHVAVLLGGWSAEREVSLISGQAVGRALRARGMRVTEIDVGPNVAEIVAGIRPDVAFNALHGRFGEDGCMQGILETLGVPYTHSGVLASALAMNKPAAKRVFRESGIACPDGVVADRGRVIDGSVMDLPFVVKPLNEGSSVGVSIHLDGAEAKPFANGEWPYGDRVLVERYVPGREITVAVMGEDALGVTEIRPKGQFYSYDAKYVAGESVHECPAQLPAEDYQAALEAARTAHAALGCRGVSRADFRYDDTGRGAARLYLLEVNTQPGMTSLSLVPEIAANAGIGFEDLVLWMVEDAGCER